MPPIVEAKLTSTRAVRKPKIAPPAIDKRVAPPGIDRADTRIYKKKYKVINRKLFSL